MIVNPLLIFFLVLPIFNWNINGREVSYQELWISGAGWVLFIVTVLGSLGAWGMAARFPITRWACVLMPTLPILVAALYPSSWFIQELFADVLTPLSALITSVVIYACLFHLPSVRRYFFSKNETNLS
jgi:hypothetical protein